MVFSFHALKKNMFHGINYFLFVSWFMYFINFNVDATVIEKIIVFFLMYKSTTYLYSTYLEDNVNKIYSALFESNDNNSEKNTLIKEINKLSDLPVNKIIEQETKKEEIIEQETKKEEEIIEQKQKEDIVSQDA